MTNLYLGMPPPQVSEWIKAKAEEKKILHFTALEDGGAGISLATNGSPDPISLECKVNDGSWSSWDLSEVQLQKDNVMYVRAVDENKKFSKDFSNYYKFSMSGRKVAAGGSVQYLLKKDGDIDSVPSFGFYQLFYRCFNLTQAPELPATTLASKCYDFMFYNCSNLTKAPELPATTLADSCYYGMFYNCSNLTKAPKLLATTLAYRCYNNMFIGCNTFSEVHMPSSMDGVYDPDTHGNTYKTVVYDL